MGPMHANWPSPVALRPVCALFPVALQAIKAESAMVAARKAQLEMELMSLIKEGADELAAHLQELDVVGEEGEEGAGAEAEEGKGQAQAAAAES